MYLVGCSWTSRSGCLNNYMPCKASYCNLAVCFLVLLSTAGSIPITRHEFPNGQHCCPVNESLLWRKIVSGLTPNARTQLDPFLTHQFLLPELQLMAGLKYLSSARRLRKFVSYLMKGSKPLKVGVVGGSISWGQGTTLRGERDWFSLLMKWLTSVAAARSRSSSPRGMVSGRNGCLPGTPSFYMVLCADQSVDSDVDLVLVEYVFNDGVDDQVVGNGVVRSVEQLVRLLQDLPGRPAVVLVQVPHVRMQDFDPFFRTSEDLEGSIAAYYDLPTVSLRDALFPLNVHHPTSGFLWHETYNQHHPGDAGHQALADLVVNLIQETALGLLTHPPSSQELEELKWPLPPPMYQANLPPTSSVCVVGTRFTSLVTSSSGWIWINEGNDVKPKWGYVTTEPGSEIRIQLTQQLAAASAVAMTTTTNKHRASSFPVLIHYLRSYTGMGTARLECSGGCSCKAEKVDSMHHGHTSQTHMAALLVTWPDLEVICELRVTVLNVSSSSDGVGGVGHKFKVSGVVVAFGYDSFALTSINNWHIPEED